MKIIVTVKTTSPMEEVQRAAEEAAKILLRGGANNG